jgi:hypothetical protein
MSASALRRAMPARVRTAAVMVLSTGRAAAGMAALTQPEAAWAAQRPKFKAPFACNTTWKYTTYAEHGANQLDFTHPDGQGKSMGKPVLASAKGKVDIADRTGYNGGAGKYVVLNHGGGWDTRYLHLDSIAVSAGDRVDRGDKIGTVGHTGETVPPDRRGSHLHYEQRLNRSVKPAWFDGKKLEPPPGRIKSTNGCGDDGDDGGTPPDPPEQQKPYVTGRALGVAADVPLLGLPLGIEPTPDTGEVRTSGKKTVSPPCAQSADVPALVTVEVLCAEVVAKTKPNRITSTASVQDTKIAVQGLPLISVQGVQASSTSSCGTSTGGVDLELKVDGTPVEVGDLPNQEIDLGVAPGTRLVVNEHSKTKDGGLTVNALHLSAPGGVDVRIASATSNAHSCT